MLRETLKCPLFVSESLATVQHALLDVTRTAGPAVTNNQCNRQLISFGQFPDTASLSMPTLCKGNCPLFAPT